MATLMYPVKMLHDENNQPFIPFTAIDVIYNKYTSTSQLPTPAREGNVATVQSGNDYNLYIYYNGAWAPLTQEGPAGVSGVYEGTTAPTDPNMTVWIDTSASTNVLKLKNGNSWDGITTIQGTPGRDGAIQYTGGSGININSSTNIISADVDNEPTASSTKLVTSGGIKTYVDNAVQQAGGGDMLKSVYDTDNDGIVDNAEKVNNHTVLSDVPANAVFTDTTYVFNTTYDAITNKAATMGDIASKQDVLVFKTAYNAVSNKAVTEQDLPTIPTIGNATLTIQKNGTTVDTFTANATSNKTINITVPTMLSGTSEPTSSQGSNGDLYILLEQ